MAGQVGKVIATELKDPKDIPTYEFPDRVTKVRRVADVTRGQGSSLTECDALVVKEEELRNLLTSSLTEREDIDMSSVKKEEKVRLHSETASTAETCFVSGHVKVAMTQSELAMLEATSSEVLSLRSSASTTDSSTKSFRNQSAVNLSASTANQSSNETKMITSSNCRADDIVKSRLITTTAVLITCGLFGVIVNVFASPSNEKGLRSTAVGLTTMALALFVRDWYRLHGQKLSRRLTPLINASQLIVNWNFIPWFDMFLFDKQTIAGKYLFNAEGPIVNEDIPRTPNKSPPHSPKKKDDNAAVSVEMNLAAKA